MERIHYANGSVLTGSEISQALLGYAEALAKRGSSATVAIPTRHADDSLGEATLLLGPASQIIAETETSDLDEVIDHDLVASFVAATGLLSNTEPEKASEPLTPMILVEDEFEIPGGVDL